MNAGIILVTSSAMVAAAVMLFRVPRLALSHGACDDVLVVIPARNEADVIHRLLDDLAQQTAQPAGIVVVDDDSDDATCEVVDAAARRWPRLPLELRRAPTRPTTWNPKSWAMHQGVSGQEPWLLFLDADVRLAPEALASISALRSTLTPGPRRHGTRETGSRAHRGGLVSVAPRHDVGSVAESLSLPFNLIAIMGATRPGRRRGDANAAFGPCMLVSRATYDEVGGHAAVRGDLLDDVALAQRVRSAGHPVQLRLGASLVRYRMYPQGLRAVVDGWTKNIASGATRVAPLVGAATALWVTASLLPWWLLVVARNPTDRMWALLLWMAVAAHTSVLARRVGRFGPMAVLFAPLVMLFFVCVAVRSGVLLVARRPVRWKGRMLEGERGMIDG